MFQNFIRLLIFFPLIFMPSILYADNASRLEKRVIEYTLSNGMRWLLVKRKEAPVFSGVVMVRAGSAEEEMGKTGLAHMFEHMALKGSREIGTRNPEEEFRLLEEIHQLGRKLTELKKTGASKEEREPLQQEMARLSQEIRQFQVQNEVWEIMIRNGAVGLNAFTSKDETAYHASMPKSRLELWAYVMSEIVGDPVLREFYTERDVVAEERRQSVENNPTGRLAESLANAAFSDGPYHWSTIGLEEDINGLTDLDAEAFHQRYYVGKNMVGVIVGDISLMKTKRILKKYFGPLPRGKLSKDPKLSSPRKMVRKKISMDASPAFAMAYHKSTLPHEDEYAFDMINAFLCNGASSRLEKRLVYDEGMARTVSCFSGYPGIRLPNLNVFWIEPIAGISSERVERVVQEELIRLQQEPLSKDEMERLRRREKAHFVYALEENMDIAFMLARFETAFRDWRLVPEYGEKLEQVTSEDIMRVAQTWFIPENMVVVERGRE